MNQNKSFLHRFSIFFDLKEWTKYYERVQEVDAYQLDEDTAIELQNISLTVDKKCILDVFNYKFKKSSVYGIIGPSGSGKSVLITYFNGISKSNQGNVILYNGQTIKFYKRKIRNYREIRRSVGMVLQFPEYQLFKETVIDDVSYGLKMLGFSPVKCIELAKEKLLDLGIDEQFLKQNPFTLSGGQKRKVALAGILAINPEIIIFDEPTIGLDPLSKEKIIEIIKDLKANNKTIILVSHNLDMILELSDKILVLREGKLVDDGAPYYIFRNPLLKVGKPKVIEFVDQLIEKNNRFAELLDYKPKNVEELSTAIANVINK